MDNEIKELGARATLARGGRPRVVDWPKEIQAECVRLLDLGANYYSISTSTGITVKALKKWQAKPPISNGCSPILQS